MNDEVLVVEDFMLLLLDDRSGSIAGAGTLHYTLGGAVLVELALAGRVAIDEGEPGLRAGLSGPIVRAIGDGPLLDPLLQAAYDKVAEKPQRVQPLLLRLSDGLREAVLDRLLDRRLIRSERRRLLGLIPLTTMPVGDARHEDALRRRVCAVLEDGERPDAHTAAVIALVSASGALPTLHPFPKWSGSTYQRGKELEQGHWGAKAVGTAVTRTAAAIAASSAAVIVSGLTN